MENMKDKNTLMKEYLAINVNSATALQALQKDAENYLVVNGHDNEIKNLLHTVKALIHCLLTDDMKASYELVYPMLDDLEFCKYLQIMEYAHSSVSETFHLAMLTDALTVCIDLEKALYMTNALEKWLVAYKEKEPANYDILISGIYTNIAQVLLYSKYFSEDWHEKYIAEFDKYISLAMDLSYKSERYSQCEMNKLRKYIFYKGKYGIKTCLEIIKVYEGDEVHKVFELEAKKYN